MECLIEKKSKITIPQKHHPIIVSLVITLEMIERHMSRCWYLFREFLDTNRKPYHSAKTLISYVWCHWTTRGYHLPCLCWLPCGVAPSFAQAFSLRWRHYGRDSVSNHQLHDCLLNRSIRRRSKKASKVRVTGLCAGNSPGTGEFPEQMASNAECVSIWWRHYYIKCYPILVEQQNALIFSLS